MTNSVGISESTDLPRGQGALNRFAEEWGQRYDRNPKDKTTAMTYAHALRALGQHAQAVAVLQGLAARNPQDREILGAYGKSLADAGRLKEAAAVLVNAHTPERPNWSILSAQGSVADQLGEHDQAQNYYKAALRMRPDEPSVMSNLGLSYALDKKLPDAEQTLRDAANNPRADMRVRQNLALVLALEGKFGEAEDWSRRDLAPIDAAANVASIRKMIAQSNTWRDLQQLDRQAQRRDPPKNSTSVAAVRPLRHEAPASLANAD
jgi:Flp pilus assembly protein TadD